MQARRVQHRSIFLLCSVVISFVLASGVAATHLVDYRLSVYGTVRDGTSFPGKILAGQPVVARFADSQQPLNSGVTNEQGEYDLLLHVHNADLGKVIVIESQGGQERFTVVFDPSDSTTERRVRVDLVVFPAAPRR